MAGTGYDIYLWLVVVGSFASFFFGWATGSNDVANAFGTSVGSRTLSLRQAVLLASCFEFAGALILGRTTTSTVAGGIADTATFSKQPALYAYGMVCALTVAGFWNFGASYLELNTSSTHSIIGSIIGFALAYKGSVAVNWAKPQADFPSYGGVVPIVISWFLTPAMTAFASAVLFLTARTLILRRQNSYTLSFWMMPPMVFLNTWINTYFVLTKGAAATLKSVSDWSTQKAGWIAVCVAAGLSLLVAFIVLPILRMRSSRHFAAEDERAAGEAAEGGKEVGEADYLQKAGVAAVKPEPLHDGATLSEKMAHAAKWSKYLLFRGVDQDIHSIVKEDDLVSAIHENAELFDPKAEWVFSYLQVFSAICVIFAHGANDVAYMVGPLAAIWTVYDTGKLASKVDPPIWIILIGAFGLVLGLATYGYNVCRAMGTKMAKLTPSRGFAAELATAMIIMIASQYSLPTSSSQCITGGIVGVGLVEGKAGVNWRFLGITMFSWIVTMVITGLLTAALFSQGAYAPSVFPLA